ncbi:MAG: hypothetical protein ACK595_18940, partial [Planctomycetota bacterium]
MTMLVLALGLLWAALALHDTIAVRRLPRLPGASPDPDGGRPRLPAGVPPDRAAPRRAGQR